MKGNGKIKVYGKELTRKTLGVIGAGNIGGIVCEGSCITNESSGLRSVPCEEKAESMGIEKVELNELLQKADFITLHVPYTEATKNILSRENLSKKKKAFE